MMLPQKQKVGWISRYVEQESNVKKIILISLVIFFAICSKSWAGDADGKGLICIQVGIYFVNLDEYNYYNKDKYFKKYFYFSEGKTIIYQISASNSFPKVKIEKLDFSIKYKESAEFIRWSFQPKNSDYPIVWEVNRKNLEMREKKNPIHGVLECSVADTWDEFSSLLNKEVELQQIELDEEIKNNKL